MGPVRRVEVDGSAVEVVLPAPDRVAEGKFVVGVRRNSGLAAVIFDPSAPMHADIGARFGLVVLGGGFCRLEPDSRVVWLWGASGQFGREPDRGWTRRALLAALPGFTVEETC